MDILTYYKDIPANEMRLEFVRGLYDTIDCNRKMIAITRARGAG